MRFKVRILLTYNIIIILLMLLLTVECIADDITNHTLAVLDLEANGVSNVEAKRLSEKIRTRIVWLIQNPVYANNSDTEKYLLVERSQMDKIFDQFDIQNTVCTDIACAIEFGKMLQFNRIIIRSVNQVGQTFNVTARMVDIESSRTVNVSEVDFKGSIDGLMGSRIQDVADELLLDCTFRDWEKSEYIPVSGTPNDATVSINGKKAGIAPIANRMVPAGNVNVEVQKLGFEDYTQNILIKKAIPYSSRIPCFPRQERGHFSKVCIFLEAASGTPTQR